jgi:methionyl-tRNA synthetase
MLNIDAASWTDIADKPLLQTGHVLGEAALLFEKMEEEVIVKQIEKLNATKSENSKTEKIVTPLKAETTFDDFSKMDLRVGTIIAAEKVAKADKLLKLTIDTGIDQRTVVSGIALHYSPEEIIGQQVTLLANLAPRKLKGIESAGMILMAEDENGKLIFIQPTINTTPGSTIS